MKCDNVTNYDLFHWNWSQSCVCDDAIIVVSCVCKRIEVKIQQLDAEKMQMTSQTLLQFLGCIDFINETLEQIQRLQDNPNHAKWFNKSKKMYSINNTMIIDQDVLFIYVDLGYRGSFYDITILNYSNVYDEYHKRFTATNGYYKYLLGDPSYEGEEQFNMRRLGDWKLSNDADESLVKTYKKMHGGYCVWVKWDIGGLKQKW